MGDEVFKTCRADHRYGGCAVGYVAAIGVNSSLLQASESNVDRQDKYEDLTGAPGSPTATTTIDGNQLPSPDPKFGGVIKDNALQSKAWPATRIVPPKKVAECSPCHD